MPRPCFARNESKPHLKAPAIEQDNKRLGRPNGGGASFYLLWFLLYFKRTVASVKCPRCVAASRMLYLTNEKKLSRSLTMAGCDPLDMAVAIPDAFSFMDDETLIDLDPEPTRYRVLVADIAVRISVEKVC